MNHPAPCLIQRFGRTARLAAWFASLSRIRARSLCRKFTSLTGARVRASQPIEQRGRPASER